MKFYKLFLIVFLSSFAFLTPSAVFGGASGGSIPVKKTEDRVYAGLVWTLKEKPSYTPDLILGYRSLTVKSNDDNVHGGDLSIRMKLEGGVSFDSTRLVYVGGERDLLGNIGVGYSNTNSGLLGTIAVQGSYARLGTDYELNKNKFVPYLELNTLDKPNKVLPTVLSPG